MLKWAIAILTFFISACGSISGLTSKTELRIRVFGVYESPASASGNATPSFYELSISNLTLTDSDGTPHEFSPETSSTLRIIDRPQLVFSGDMTDYADMSFNKVSLTVDPNITVGGEYANDYSLTLSSSTIQKSTDFTIKKAETVDVNLKILWQNTITRDTEAKTEAIAAPSFELSVN